MAILNWLVPTRALRKLSDEQSPRVTNMELFFDLVYVFTIIQLSHYLLEHQTITGVIESITLFAAIWWAWNYTAWSTNWINPDHGAGRLFMVALMACALTMAIAMPYAFTERAWMFVGAYVTMALLRAFYMAALFRGERMGQNYAQLGAWSCFSALFWVAGVLVPEQRLLLWGIAVLVEYAAPFVGFWLPGAGATPMDTWPLKGLHLLERNQQVFIIALGESILLLGGTLVAQTLSMPTVFAAGIGFALIVVLWWLYFLHTTEHGEHAFTSASDHTKLARAGLAYAHGIMVCGAIAVAVAIELILAHPLDAVHLETVLIAVLGPCIFLVGSAAFHRTMADRYPYIYLFAMLALPAWGYLALNWHVTGLVLGGGVLGILLVLVALAARGPAEKN